MKYRLVILVIIFLLSFVATAQDKVKNKPKINYQYKKYEYFDLGNLDIKGSLIAPGDLSIQKRKIKEFDRGLFQRNDFDKECLNDIFSLM